MFRSYLYKVSHSVAFYLSVIGVLAMCCTRLFGQALTGADVVTEMDILLDIDAFRKVMAVFAAIPFVSNFSQEWLNGCTYSRVLRTSGDRYIMANISACFVTSFITVFIGMMLFAYIYTLQYPLYVPTPNGVLMPYGVLTESGYPFLYIAVKVFIFSASCAMWSISGLALSALFPDPFVAICSPFVASYLIERLSMQLPDTFNLWYLSLGRVSIYDNAVVSFIYAIVIFVTISAIFGAVFYNIVKGRLANEIV